MIFGRLFDGESAAAQKVRVEADANTLTLHFVESPSPSCNSFPKKEWALCTRIDGTRELVLNDTTRIILEGDNIEQWIRGHTFSTGSSFSTPKRWRKRSFVSLVTLTVGIIGLLLWTLPQCAVLFVPLIPISTEDDLGSRLHSGLVKHYKGECNNSEAKRIIQRFVDSLLSQSKVKRAVRVTLLNSPVLNAFAAPGGNIYILQGILKQTSSGNELAAVVAHELGHVIERHTMKTLAQQIGLRIVSTYLGATFDNIGETSLLFSSQLVGLSYSRNHEREADSTGMSLLLAAGIDSKGAASFFSQVKEKLGDPNNGISGFFATHPSHTERIETLLKREASGKPAFSEEDWRAIKAGCGAF